MLHSESRKKSNKFQFIDTGWISSQWTIVVHHQAPQAPFLFKFPWPTVSDALGNLSRLFIPCFIVVHSQPYKHGLLRTRFTKKKKCTPIPNLNQNKIVKLNKLSFSHINKPDEADQELHLTATTSNPNPEHLRVFFVMRLLTVLSVFLIGSPWQKKNG